MKTTTVRKGDLLVQLQQNRDQHEADYIEARATWRTKVLERLAVVRDQAVNNNWANVASPLAKLPKPEHFLKSYDAAIAQLQWEVAEHIELDEDEFSNYVLDDWSWRGRFVANTSSYLV